MSFIAGEKPPPLADRPESLISGEQFDALAAAGLVDRVELLGGRLYPKVNALYRHNALVAALAQRLRTDGFADRVWEEKQVELPGPWRPHPDVSILRADPLTLRRNPTLADIDTLIEVSDHTIESDRSIKLPHYRAVGIPAAFMLALVGDRVELYGYGDRPTVVAAIRAVVEDPELKVVRLA